MHLSVTYLCRSRVTIYHQKEMAATCGSVWEETDLRLRDFAVEIHWLLEQGPDVAAHTLDPRGCCGLFPLRRLGFRMVVVDLGEVLGKRMARFWAHAVNEGSEGGMTGVSGHTSLA
jgi:hypothetical protein